MAKNKKDLLGASFTPKRKTRTDEKIKDVATDIHEGKKDIEQDKLKGLHVLLPLSDFDKLTIASKKLSFPKKIIVLQALRDYFEKHGF